MVQVFTNHASGESRSVTLGGGSFSTFDGSAGYSHALNPDWRLDLHAAGRSGDGWQDRTHANLARGRASLAGAMGRARLAFDVSALSDRDDWGTPIPVDEADPV